MRKIILLFLYICYSSVFGQYTWNGAQLSTLTPVNYWVYPCADIGADGNTYLLYRYMNMDDLRIQKWNGTAWSAVTSIQVTDVPNLANINDYQSIAVDGSNHIHIVFRGNHTNGNTGIWYGYYNGTAWSFDYVAGYPPASGAIYITAPIIHVDAANKPYIVFIVKNSGVSPTQDVMKCADKSSGSWNITDVETILEDHGSEFDYYDFAVSSAGVPQVVYADEYNNDCLYDIRYEYYNGSAWVPATIATGVYDYSGSLSIVVNSAGKAYVALATGSSDYTNFQLDLYDNTSGSFVSTTSFSNTAGYEYCISDMLINSNDDVAILYYKLDWGSYEYSEEYVLIQEGISWAPYSLAGQTAYSLGFYETAFTFDASKNIVCMYANDLGERPRLLSYYTGSYSDPLPVELTSFNASQIDNGIELKWQTAAEVNNYGFEIEKSLVIGHQSLTKWEKVGFVQGSGNSNSPKEYSFIDANPIAGIVQYRLKQIDNDGRFKYYSNIAEVNFNITDVNGRNMRVPTEYALEQNYPNPFNPSTRIQYAVGNGSEGSNSKSSGQYVTLKVYGLLGNEVATLVNEHKAPGYYEVEFSAGNLATGVYIYRLTAGSFTSTKKLILMK